MIGHVAQDRDYRERFARFAVRAGLLRFGRFTTKSGRASPYFFNTGACADGAALSELGGYYAAAIGDRFPDATVLFGPSYKGITLSAAAAMALSRGRAQPVGFCFDRKERGAGDLSALDELAREFDLPTAAIATISQIVDVLSQQPVDGRALIDAELRGRIQAYLQQYAPR